MIGATSRSRVAKPNGVVEAVAVVAAVVALMFLLGYAGEAAFVAIFHREPRDTVGDPYWGLMGLVGSATLAGLATLRLRIANGGIRNLRWFTRADVRVLLIGVIALMSVRLANDLVLDALHLSDHVQAGFEEVDFAMGTPWATAGAAALLFAGAAVAAPFAEELVFRGLLFGGFAEWWGVVPAAIVSSLLFAAVHGDAVFFAAIAVDGLIYALAYATTGNLAVAIALHALANGLVASNTIVDQWPSYKM